MIRTRTICTPAQRRAMRRVASLGALGAALCVTGAARADAQSSSPRRVVRAANSWRLVWRDEFDGAAIDTTRWAFDLGRGFLAPDGKTLVDGWGNNELQCYTRDTANVAVHDGRLHIRALPSADATCPYTSARLKTRRPDGRALFAQRYGRFEFRAKLPMGQGLWPALWMLPLADAYGTWAASGEIDVMEARGQTPSTVLGTLHYGARWPANTHTGADYVLPRGGSIADFHTYAVEWEPGRIRWFVDGVHTQSQGFWWSASPRDTAGTPGAADLNPWPAPFDQPFYLVMNLAVGGNFLGNPDASTRFPGVMEVDFVRVYERRARSAQVFPRGAGRFPWSPQ